MEFMPNFKVHRPISSKEAVKLLGEQSDSKFVAGGTDLIVNVRRGIEQPKNLIDLSSIAELREIKENSTGLQIGAGATLNQLTSNSLIQSNFPAIAEAAASVAGGTHQQYGTLGGNLCLDTRCLFYNQSEWWRQSNDYCMKERGEVCHVAPGGKRCFAAFSGDVAPAMLIYQAKVILLGPQGERRIPLAEMYRNDGMNHLTLTPGELVSKVQLPKSLSGTPSRYEKIRIRGSIDFPLAGVAVRLKMNKKKVKEISIALTGVNPFPQIITGTDEHIGKSLNEKSLDDLQNSVRKQAKPMKTTTVAPWYRRRVVGAVAKKLIKELAV
ncbi:MAG: 4-hydroxybenzoyl-CoA reductase subunit beta [Pseudomonadota bacterium]|nr:4-hydroxybenzoyl-CoA reductase subunit beta [Pseudomonadota bacterium]